MQFCLIDLYRVVITRLIWITIFQVIIAVLRNTFNFFIICIIPHNVLEIEQDKQQ